MKGGEDSDKAQTAQGRIQWHMFVNTVYNSRLDKNMELAYYVLSSYRSLWSPFCLTSEVFEPKCCTFSASANRATIPYRFMLFFMF
jgi:hypothetical protein